MKDKVLKPEIQFKQQEKRKLTDRAEKKKCTRVIVVRQRSFAYIHSEEQQAYSLLPAAQLQITVEKPIEMNLIIDVHLSPTASLSPLYIPTSCLLHTLNQNHSSPYITEMRKAYMITSHVHTFSLTRPLDRHQKDCFIESIFTVESISNQFRRETKRMKP